MTSNGPTRRGVLAVLGTGLVAPLATGCGHDAPAGSAAPTTSAPSTDPTSITPSGQVSPTGVASVSASDSASASGPGAGSAAADARRRPAGPDITHGPRNRTAVALTFHGAGDVGILRGMLADFAAAGAKVTVLAIGQWLAADPQAARMILDGGHELGNHSWSHQTMPRLGTAQLRTEVGRAAAELRTLTGSPGVWFRPSGTPHSTAPIRAAAVAAGYGACLGYDVDPLDYTDPGPAAVLRNFVAGVGAGSIVSLHLGHQGTLAAMPGMLAHLHDRGLAAVTASDLLGR